MKYVVEVKQRPPTLQPYTGALTEAFHISEARAKYLVACLPGAVTKPVSVSLAKEIARRFRASGLDAVARSELLPEALELDFELIDFSDDTVFQTVEQMRQTMLGVMLDKPTGSQAPPNTTAPTDPRPNGTAQTLHTPRETDLAQDGPAQVSSEASEGQGKAPARVGSLAAATNVLERVTITLQNVLDKLRRKQA